MKHKKTELHVLKITRGSMKTRLKTYRAKVDAEIARREAAIAAVDAQIADLEVAA